MYYWYYWVVLGFMIGTIPSFFAYYYLHKIDEQNKELRDLLLGAETKIKDFIDARRKGAIITNSKRKR